MPDPTRRLWQIPTLLLGLTAFIGAYQGWLPPGIARDHSAGNRADVAALQSIAAKPNPDPGQLRTQIGLVAGSVDANPQQAPFAHFVLGTAYMRLAELTADPADAHASWTLAKQHFEVVKPEQLTDPADAPRLVFRLGKSRAATAPADLPAATIDHLRTMVLAVPLGEPSGDGHRFAADLALRQTPPDLNQAKTAYTAFIAETGLGTPPATIARTKLKLSEVHRRLGDADGAKKWLMQIGTDAPADVLPTAKAQLARIRMDEGDFTAARRDWELLLAQPTLPAGLKPTATYQLGMCLISAKTPDFSAAAKRFEDATRIEGPEAAAAAVRLAEIRLKSEDPDRRKDAAALLALAVKGLASPADYPKAPLIPIHEVQAAFESAIDVLRKDKSYESAAAIAKSYGAVAAPGRDLELRGETLGVWAESIEKSGGNAAVQYTSAGELYANVAKIRTSVADQADLLRKSAGLYMKAGSTTAALASFEQAVKLPNLPDEVAGPLWLDYAKTLVALQKPDQALPAFQKVFALGGPAATTARYTVARNLIDSKVPDKVQFGVALMDQVAQAETVSKAEQDMHERALVDVANAYIQKGEFAEAESRLEKQMTLYPAGVEASLGRLLLGVCLVQRADPRAKPPAANPAKNLEEALKLFRQVVVDVEARAKDNKPVERDPWLRIQSSLRVLQTFQKMSRPHDVLKEGDLLRREYAGTVEELIVLSIMYHAYKQLDKPEGVFSIHNQMKVAFDKMKDKPGAFRAKTGEYSREYWEKVWFQPEPMK